MRCIFTITLLTILHGLSAQDSSTNTVVNIPDKYISSVDNKIQSLDNKLTRQTENYLNSLSKQEEKLHRQLAKIDSSKAAEVFGDIKNKYENLSQKLNGATGKFDKIASGEYMAGLDSLQGSLAFLKDAANIVSKTKDTALAQVCRAGIV